MQATSENVSAHVGWLPKSPNLTSSLARAGRYTLDQGQPFITTEHLLLALTEDVDAIILLGTSGIDLVRLRRELADYLSRSQLASPEGASQVPVPSNDLVKIFDYASAAAERSGRRFLDGAMVLAALIGDERSPAAQFLRGQGLTYDEAIKALRIIGGQRSQGGGATPTEHHLPHQASAPSAEEAALDAAEIQQSDAAPIAEPEPGSMTRPNLEPDHARLEYPSSAHEGAGALESANTARQPTAKKLQPADRIRPEVHDVRDATASQPVPGVFGSSSPPSQAQPASAPEQAPAQQPGAGTQLSRLPRRADTQPNQHNADPRHGPTPESQSAPTGARTTAPPMELERAPPQGAAPARTATGQDLVAARRRQAEHCDMTVPSAGAAGPATPRQQQRREAHPLGPGAPNAQQLPPGLGSVARAPAGHPQQRVPQQRPAPAQAPPQRSPASQTPPQSGRAPQQPPQQQAPRGHPGEAAGHVVTLQDGVMVENIPRRMRKGVTQKVEVRIARSDIERLAEDLSGGGRVHRHDIFVTRAMSIRLRAPEGGFTIESASAETQWIEDNIAGLLMDDYASWRWSITPTRTGWSALQLIVSARTVGPDGLTADSALPEQEIEVQVLVNYRQTAKRITAWAAVALAGGVVGAAGQQIWSMLAG